MLLRPNLKNLQKNKYMAVCLKKSKNKIKSINLLVGPQISTSHFDGYEFTIHEPEVDTKDLQYRRDIKSGKTPSQNNKYRLCNYCVEDITHVTSRCSKMLSR